MFKLCSNIAYMFLSKETAFGIAIIWFLVLILILNKVKFKLGKA